VWTLFGLIAAIALCFSFAPHPLWRVTLPAAAVALGWWPGLAVLAARGPFAVRRVEWTAEGEWLLTGLDGRCRDGRLAGATAQLGPWILLAWTVRAGRWRLLSRRYALIGVSELGPTAFRTLAGRLALLAGRQCEAAGPWPPDN
jgi:hypothetical protein